MGLKDLLGNVPILGEIGPSLPVVGPLLFNEPGQKELQAQLQAVANSYNQMKIPMQQARFRGLGNAMAQFRPAADMLGQMYGQQFRPPIEQGAENTMVGLFGDVPALNSPFNPANVPGGMPRPQPQPAQPLPLMGGRPPGAMV